jgi:hypothetical protein
LSSLHQRLDTTSAQLDGLRRLASEPVGTAMRAEDIAHITAELGQRTEASIDILTRKTEDSIALARQATRASGRVRSVRMLGALDGALSSLIASRSHARPAGPDLEAFADRVAQRTSEALGRPVEVSKPMNDADLEAFETRVADLIRSPADATQSHGSIGSNRRSRNAARVHVPSALPRLPQPAPKPLPKPLPSPRASAG